MPCVANLVLRSLAKTPGEIQKVKSMEWYVYYCDWNKDKIEPINILGGSYVNSEIKKIKNMKLKNINEYLFVLFNESNLLYFKLKRTSIKRPASNGYIGKKLNIKIDQFAIKTS